MAKTSTAKAGPKQAAPAKAVAAAGKPASKAARAGKAAAPAAKVAKATPARTRPATAKKPAARGAAGTAKAKGAGVAAKAARKLAGKAAPALRPTVDGGDKPRLVRDSFTMPEHEYAVLAEVKQACLKAGFDIKKSELLRIGVALISQLDMATLQGVLANLPQLKTGRPRSR